MERAKIEHVVVVNLTAEKLFAIVKSCLGERTRRWRQEGQLMDSNCKKVSGKRAAGIWESAIRKVEGRAYNKYNG